MYLFALGLVVVRQRVTTSPEASELGAATQQLKLTAQHGEVATHGVAQHHVIHQRLKWLTQVCERYSESIVGSAAESIALLPRATP